MRKIGRANTSEDCRRLHLPHATTTPNQHLQSNCDVAQSPRPGIDAEKLLATTNSEDAIKILTQATSSSTFSMSTEATKLMSTLQLSPLPPGSVSMQEKSMDKLPEASHYSDLSRVQTSTPPFKDYMNHIQTYAYMQNAFTTENPSTTDSFSSNEKCILSRFPISSYSGDFQTQYSSSTDEGCETDLEDNTPAPRLSYASSSSSSGVVTNFNSKSLSQNLSRDSSQSNFSTFESFEYQLSDSSDLASSLPSCTSTDRIGMSGTDHVVTSTSAIHSNVYVSKSNRALVTNKHNPLVYISSAKSGARNLTRSPVDFREGRRASDGLVAQQINQADNNAINNVIAFNSQKLSENPKAKGVLELHLVQKEAKKLKTQYQANVPIEEVIQMQQKHTQYNLSNRIPKRISLPDNFNYVAPVSSNSVVETESSVSKPPLQQIMQHRLLQQKRQILQKQCALSHQSQNASIESSSHLHLSRRQMLRQASYKMAQQTQILPPLPLSDENKELIAFQTIVEGAKDNSIPYRNTNTTNTDNWNNLPSTLQTSCQISDISGASNLAWQHVQSQTTWNQVHF